MQLFLHLNGLIMLLSCSGDLNESFEYPFEVVAQSELEISSKINARSNFFEKSGKKHKILGSHLKKIFLPNKKYFSLVSDGIRNFLCRGFENLFLTSPPIIKLKCRPYHSNFIPERILVLSALFSVYKQKVHF